MLGPIGNAARNNDREVIEELLPKSYALNLALS
jgi:hypothetical protein